MTAPSSRTNGSSPRGYEAVSAFAKQHRLAIPDAIALTRENDPFFIGSPAHRILAEWFTSLWQRFGAGSGMHIRRMHYQTFSVRDVFLPNGKPYENTDDCWKTMSKASKFARILRMVPVDDFVDRRNPNPHLHASSRRGISAPQASVGEPETPMMPAILLDGSFSPSLPEPYAMGYEYEPGDQPVHVEVWCEKSTMDDILVPLCRSLDVNYVTSIGYQSISNEVELLRRSSHSGKPCRILYISDFDAAGSGMPRAVSRQIEYWLPDYLDPDGADVKLTLLALTRDQVDFYNLPNAPGAAKSSNDRFEREQGRGTVELDALEALRPGTLAQLVSDAVRPYRDEGLPRRLTDAARRASRIVASEWETVTQPLREEIDRITAGVAEVASRYTARVQDLQEQLQSELVPYEEAVEAVFHGVQEAAVDFAPDLPKRPEPETDGTDESDWLFDSSRDYLTQLASYKRAGTGDEVSQ